MGPVFHRFQAYPDMGRLFFLRIVFLYRSFRYALSVVAYLDDQLASFVFDGNVGMRRAGVLDDIVHRFLNDTVQIDFLRIRDPDVRGQFP
jgi:hypothetical protein